LSNALVVNRCNNITDWSRHNFC